MLTTHLNAIPYAKCVLIEDTITAKSNAILEYLLRNHENHKEYRTHCFVFERNFNKIKDKYTNCICYDFTSDLRNWLSDECDLKKSISNLNDNCVVVVDSLAHVLYRYGVAETYKIFSEIKNKTNVQQIILVLHTDLLDNKDAIVQYFKHLATLHMELEPKRVSYMYKKGPRKIIKQIEEYHFENGRFITEAIKKPDKEVIKEAIERIIPENMSTFKIGLTEKDKESRENLVLPYLPRDDENGQIHYTFDDIDDWDEEDPDDDLDI